MPHCGRGLFHSLSLLCRRPQRLQSRGSDLFLGYAETNIPHIHTLNQMGAINPELQMSQLEGCWNWISESTMMKIKQEDQERFSSRVTITLREV